MTKQSKPPAASLALTELFDQLGADYVKWVQSIHLNSGVSHIQLRLLGILYEEGPQIMSDLSTDLGVTPRYITTLVDALEHKGMLERRSHESDRRATVIALTPKGGSVGVLMSGPHQEEVARLFDCLAASERRELLRLLGKVRTALEHLRESNPK